MNNITKDIKNVINYNIFKSLSLIRQEHTDVKVKYPKIEPLRQNKKLQNISSIHPYRKIHLWESKSDFIQCILDRHLLYNVDGLVAINKPYGISARIDPNLKKKSLYQSGIYNEVNYTITDALPHLATKLNYESLSIVKCPEKYTSGVILLSANDKIKKAVEKSLERAEKMRFIPRTYWAITRRVPICKESEERLAIKLMKSPDEQLVIPMIVKNWSNNEQRRQDVKILNVQYKVLGNSTQNLASLVEIKSSTTQFHAVRLFAAVELLSPILGDRVHGSRSQQIMGRFITISPFIKAAHVTPRLDKDLLKLLRITQGSSTMIPVHLHLKEMFLPSLLQKGHDVEITAPLHPEFLFTCRRLKFEKEILRPTKTKDNTDDIKTDSNSEVDKEQCATIT